jgi:cytosine deaminase
MATFGGAEELGLENYGLKIGSIADLLLVEAENAAEAICTHLPRRLVLKRGRIVARAGRTLLPDTE